MSIETGWTGRYVSDVQTALKNKGFDPGPVDGKFGPGTANAVRAFQGARGLAVDGIVGQATWRALGFKGQVPSKVVID